MKTCKYCGVKYKPYNSLQPCCTSYDCIVKHRSKKEIVKRIKQFKIALKTRKDYMKILQQVFNKFIRERDKDLPCISCGTKRGDFHAGHYINSTFQVLRFNELNVNKQCAKCNTHLSGNLINYREGLINKIGIENVIELEESKYNKFEVTTEELKELIKIYRNKLA